MYNTISYHHVKFLIKSIEYFQSVSKFQSTSIHKQTGKGHCNYYFGNIFDVDIRLSNGFITCLDYWFYTELISIPESKLNSH